MEFEYELTEAELVAFDKVVHARVDTLTKAALGGWEFLAQNILAWIPIGIAGAAFIDLYHDYPQSPDLKTIAIAASLAVALMTGSGIYKRKLIEDAVKLSDDWPRAQSLVANEVGITMTSPGSSAQLSCPVVREVIEDDATLYLFFNLSHALVLPKQVFRSGDELDQLRRWAQQREVKL